MLLTYSDGVSSPAKRLVVRGVEWLSGSGDLAKRYEVLKSRVAAGESVFSTVLDVLEIRLELDGTPVDGIPREGPLLVVANHPFGIVDGVILGHLVGQVRSDFRLLAIQLLRRVPEMRDWVIPIDFASTPEARRLNLKSRSESLDQLSNGGALLLFPSGEVAASKTILGQPVESPWQPFLGRLVQTTRPTVLPVFIGGRNSWLFNAASRIGSAARLALFVRETRRLTGATVHVRIGNSIAPNEISHLTDRTELVTWLQHRTQELSQNASVDATDRVSQLDLASCAVEKHDASVVTPS